MPTNYSFDASACPVPVRPSATLIPGTNAPVTSQTFAAGETNGVAAKIAENGLRSDLVGRWGGGAYGIASGLDLGDGGGLVVNIAAGQAVVDGVVHRTATTVTLTDNIDRTHLWLSRAGAVAKVENSLTPPAGEQVYLGSVKSASGAILWFDLSGVIYLRGGQPLRRTADPGMPADTPPADLIHLVETEGGLFLWDGTRYRAVWEPLALSKETIASGEDVTLPAGYQAVICKLTVDGALTVNGTLKLIGE